MDNLVDHPDSLEDIHRKFYDQTENISFISKHCDVAMVYNEI